MGQAGSVVVRVLIAEDRYLAREAPADHGDPVGHVLASWSVPFG